MLFPVHTFDKTTYQIVYVFAAYALVLTTHLIPPRSHPQVHMRLGVHSPPSLNAALLEALGNVFTGREAAATRVHGTKVLCYETAKLE